MPTYDYKCKCGAVREVLHSITKNPRIKCWECGKTMKRQIGRGLPPKVKGALSNYKGT